VTERIVDLLEAVETDDQQRDLAALGLGARSWRRVLRRAWRL
jgi:hypothetical protein